MRYGARFWRLYAATGASDLADGIGRTALPLAAAAYTRDPFLISGLVTFAFLPWLLFALPSGALVDRLDRRRAMAMANTARAATTAALTVLLVTGEGGIVALYVCAFVLGLAETVYDSAVRALLPQVVRRDQLDGANSLLTVEETVGQTFAGAPIGAALFAVAVSLPFVLNAAGFALAVVLILSLRGGYRPVREEPTSLRADIAEGVRWLRGHALLRGLTMVSACQAFSQSMASSLLVLYVLEVVHLPASAFGLLLAAGGVGAVAGGLVTPPLARRFGRGPVITAGAVTSALSLGAMAATSNGYVAGALFAVESVGVMTWNVLTMSLRQALIPEALFGRVQGAYRTVVWGGIPLGALAGGAIASWIGIRGVVVVAASLLLGMSVVLGRLLRRHRPLLVRIEPEVGVSEDSAVAAAMP
ncbi:MFS transporter [Jatrophihabitans fulvus]